MVYPYSVNHNGKIYQAGEEVPVEKQTETKTVNVETDTNTEPKAKSTRKAK